VSRRTDRVNELLKREISAALQRDMEFTDSLVTISGVEVTPDLKEAKVYVSVLGGSEKWVMDKLAAERGAIQTKVMSRVVLKNTPVLSFRPDHSAERGVEIVNLLDEVAKLPTAPPPEEED
jgi:ribosome-binding factor A